MKTVKTVPNQKTISNDVIITGRYSRIDEATFTAGCRDLKPTTFLVWQALNLQYFTEKELALSTSVISELMGGLRIQTVKDAIKELIEKGWLVLVNGNHYSLTNPVARNASEPWLEKRATGSTETERESIIKEEEEVVVAIAPTAAKENVEVVEVQVSAAPIIRDAASEAATQQAGNALEHLIAADKTEKRCFQIGKFAPWFGSSMVDGKAAAKLELTVRELGEHVQKNYENYGCGSLINLEQVYSKTWELWSEAKQWRVASRM